MTQEIRYDLISRLLRLSKELTDEEKEKIVFQLSKEIRKTISEDKFTEVSINTFPIYLAI